MSEEELSIAFGDLTISVRRARPAPSRSASLPEAQPQRSESSDSFVLVGESSPRGEDSGLGPRVTRATAASSLLSASPAPAAPSPRASAPSARSLLAPGPSTSSRVLSSPCGAPSRGSSLGAGRGSPPQAPLSHRPILQPSSSPSRVPEYPLQVPEPEGYPQGASPLPLHLRDLCRHLRGGLLTGEQRAERAWKAGLWAAEVLAGRSRCPEASPATGLQNRYYAVLRAEIPDFLGPVVVRTFSAYSALVGRLPGGTSISHAFPSESETRVYFAGAGLAFPSR